MATINKERWVAYERISDFKTGCVGVETAEGVLIYERDVYRLTYEKQFDRARLIAAAPELLEERDNLKAVNADLLEALKHIAEYWNQDTNPQAMADACWHSIDTARAAIAKAEGL